MFSVQGDHAVPESKSTFCMYCPLNIVCSFTCSFTHLYWGALEAQTPTSHSRSARLEVRWEDLKMWCILSPEMLKITRVPRPHIVVHGVTPSGTWDIRWY